MPKEKTTFILYKDTKAFFDNLPNEEAGILIKAIFEYACNKNDIKTGVASVDVVLQFIKNKIDDNEKKYQAKKEKLAENGRLGGLAKASKCQQMLEMLGNSSLTDTLTLTDTLLSKDNIKKTKEKKEVINDDWQPSDSILKNIKDRGYQQSQIEKTRQQFINTILATNNKYKYKNFDRAFLNWITREQPAKEENEFLRGL